MEFSFFYNLTGTEYGPLSIIFLDNKKHYIQIIDEYGNFQGYTRITIPDTKNRVISEVDDIAGPEHGDLGLYAHQYGLKRVCVGPKDQIRETLSKHIRDGSFENAPFCGLSVSRFCGLSDAELRYTRRCVQKLGGIRKNAAKVWMKSTNIPMEIRKSLNEEQDFSDQGQDATVASYSATLPYTVFLAMDEMARFSEEHSIDFRSRSSIIRDATALVRDFEFYFSPDTTEEILRRILYIYKDIINAIEKDDGLSSKYYYSGIINHRASVYINELDLNHIYNIWKEFRRIISNHAGCYEAAESLLNYDFDVRKVKSCFYGVVLFTSLLRNEPIAFERSLGALAGTELILRGDWKITYLRSILDDGTDEISDRTS